MSELLVASGKSPTTGTIITPAIAIDADTVWELVRFFYFLSVNVKIIVFSIMFFFILFFSPIEGFFGARRSGPSGGYCSPEVSSMSDDS